MCLVLKNMSSIPNDGLMWKVGGSEPHNALNIWFEPITSHRVRFKKNGCLNHGEKPLYNLNSQFQDMALWSIHIPCFENALWSTLQSVAPKRCVRVLVCRLALMTNWCILMDKVRVKFAAKVTQMLQKCWTQNAKNAMGWRNMSFLTIHNSYKHPLCEPTAGFWSCQISFKKVCSKAF